MSDNDISVVVEPEAKKDAYRMGFEQFDYEPNEPVDPEWFAHYTESAEWANTKLPRLRQMAGANDPSGHGTYAEHTDVVIVEYPDDRPMSGEIVDSFYLFEELVDQFRNGAYDKIEGNDYGHTLEY